MAHSTDWLPSNRTAFHKLVLLMCNYSMQNLTRFGIGEELEEWLNSVLMPLVSEFDSAFMIWNDPASRTSVIETKTRDLETELRPLIRQFYAMLKANPKVTNEDMTTMGLPARFTNKPTPSPVPTTVPSE